MSLTFPKQHKTQLRNSQHKQVLPAKAESGDSAGAVASAITTTVYNSTIRVFGVGARFCSDWAATHKK